MSFRARAMERERERNFNVRAKQLETWACVLIKELNQQPYCAWDGAQSTEPHQPGPRSRNFKII